MDFQEAMNIVIGRIKKYEPELASKVAGYLLWQEYGERDIIRLAFGPDGAIHSLITEVKAMLPVTRVSTKPPASPPIQIIPNLHLQLAGYSPVLTHPFSCPTTVRVPTPGWDQQLSPECLRSNHNADFHSAPTHSSGGEHRLHDQLQFLSVNEQVEHVNPTSSKFTNDYQYHEAASGNGSGGRSGRRSPTLSDFSHKACHYYYKGYCKHGTNCRYLHGQAMQDGFTQFFNLSSNEMSNEDRIISSSSLEKLEFELIGLLKSRGGQPISIAMLPMLYYEKYGKMLQADGYLTESQRHGKAGFSLTRLLARLSNTIRIIDRPHGQHSVMLLEDYQKYMDYRIDRNEPGGGNVAGCQQIYLTFPAESTFSEDDVSNYFKQFGPVRDVRIPCQQKRMFGFVTFENQETAKLILSKRNPHYVCGARVLVKPYREKSRTTDRKYSEKVETSMCQPHYLESESEHYPCNRSSGFPAVAPRFLNSSRLLKKQLFEGHEQALEFQRSHLSEMHFGSRASMHQPFFGFDAKELKVQDGEDLDHFPLAIKVGCYPGDNGPSNDDKARFSNSCGDQESLELCLPDSPFASTTLPNEISAAVYT